MENVHRSTVRNSSRNFHKGLAYGASYCAQSSRLLVESVAEEVSYPLTDEVEIFAGFGCASAEVIVALT